MTDKYVSVRTMIFAILIWATAAGVLGAQSIVVDQADDTFLGIRFGTEIRTIIAEIEKRSGKHIVAEFTELDDFQLGVSYIDGDNGVPTVLVDQGLEGEDKKLEAVIAHELLHLRLRVNGFPTFLFSPSVKTDKGRAIDVEQGHVNDLLSIIEHRVFKTDLQKVGLYKYIDLAGDTAAEARKRKGSQDSQADAINYARAILEYADPRDINEVKQIFRTNGWTRSLTEGAEIASIISSDPKTPKEVESVFLRCLSTLFPTNGSTAFKLTLDPTNRYYRQMTITMVKIVRKRNR